jgi:hypothetical protein
VVTGSNTQFNYGQAAVSAAVDSNHYRWSLNNQTTVIQGVRRWDLSATGTQDIFVIWEGGTGGTNIQVHLEHDRANRRVHAYRGSGTGNLLGSSAVDSLPPSSNWFYIEWKAFINDTTGTVEVRVDGVSILTVTGADTSARANVFATGATLLSASNIRCDDYYLFDGSGAQHNDFFGPARVRTEYGTSDSAVNFTPLSGSDNFAMVDDPGDIDGDTTYNHQAASTGKDLLGINGEVPVTATVGPVELRSTFRKDDAGACTGRGVIKSNATEAPGATKNPGITYQQFRDVYELDPDGSVAWTPAKYNAIKIGYERLT